MNVDVRVRVVGVDQIEVEVARTVVRYVLDLAPHPQMPAAGEGLGQRRLDLVVESADRKDAGPLFGPVLHRTGLCALPVVATVGCVATVHWRRFRIEELTGISRCR